VEVLSPEGYPPTHQGLHAFFIHSLESPPKNLGMGLGTGKGLKIHCNPQEEEAPSTRKGGVLCSPLS